MEHSMVSTIKVLYNVVIQEGINLSPGLLHGLHGLPFLGLEVDQRCLGFLPEAARHHKGRLIDSNGAVVEGRRWEGQLGEGPPPPGVAGVQHLNGVEG